jgi:four helix bundle protein
LFFEKLKKNKMKINRFEELMIWQDARALCKIVFDLTNDGAFQKVYSLRNQIISSSGSIIDCIAEGFERDGRKEFIQFLSISKGSCGETRSQCHRALDFGLISQEQHQELQERLIRLNRQIASLMSYLKNSTYTGIKNKPTT